MRFFFYFATFMCGVFMVMSLLFALIGIIINLDFPAVSLLVFILSSLLYYLALNSLIARAKKKFVKEYHLVIGLLLSVFITAPLSVNYYQSQEFYFSEFAMAAIFMLPIIFLYSFFTAVINDFVRWPSRIFLAFQAFFVFSFLAIAVKKTLIFHLPFFLIMIAGLIVVRTLRSKQATQKIRKNFWILLLAFVLWSGFLIPPFLFASIDSFWLIFLAFLFFQLFLLALKILSSRKTFWAKNSM